LARVLNVQRFADLARLTVDEIEAHLKAENLIASRRDIATWIARAQELSESHMIKDVDGWKPFASFVVEFQRSLSEAGDLAQRTTVHYVEADHGQTWDGIECEALCEWMLEKAQLAGGILPQSIPVTAPVETVEAAAPVFSVVEVALYQPVQANTPVGTGKPGQPFFGSITQQAFRLEATLKVPVEALPLQHSFCRASFYAYERGSGRKLLLGSSTPIHLQEHISQYHVTLTAPGLSKGVYRMQIYASDSNQAPGKQYQEIPFLQVVEN
jgi:hypothetical protein